LTRDGPAGGPVVAVAGPRGWAALTVQIWMPPPHAGPGVLR